MAISLQNPHHQKIVLALVMLGGMMAAIDTTIVILALPSIIPSLHSNLSTAIWVILAYILVLAIFTTQLGKLGDLYGRAKIFNFGMLIFGISSLFCGLAFNDIMLIISRVVQAVGGAMMQATSSAIVADTFPKEKLGGTFGIITVGFTVGAILGVVLGGAITTFFGWPFIFLINVPIGIVGFALGMKYLRDARIHEGKIEFKGMALLAVLLFLLSFGAINIAAEGFAPLELGMLVAGFALVPVYLYMEKKSKNPTIDMKLFKNRMLSHSLLANFFQSLGFLAVFFILIMYLQGVRGLSPLDSSVFLIPGFAMSAILAPFTGRLADKHGARVMATLGIALMCVSILIYLNIQADTPLYWILIGSGITGVGGSMFWPANNTAIMKASKEYAYGVISGVSRTLTNIGMLLSYTIALAAAGAFIPRALALQLFVGTIGPGKISAAFVTGVHASMAISLILLIIAGIFSAMRGKGGEAE
ncbi:MAG TPA: MFS transporter [Candidatus Baltobacteraceae bacterium]|nr:MFS transporter [Candidatus Baltobacteraceae bacterium]